MNKSQICRLMVAGREEEMDNARFFVDLNEKGPIKTGLIKQPVE